MGSCSSLNDSLGIRCRRAFYQLRVREQFYPTAQVGIRIPNFSRRGPFDPTNSPIVHLSIDKAYQGTIRLHGGVTE